ncbi:hypothetical protein YWIDRAFT_05201 [Streptomyces sp. SceaMP-e96]|nr:hypothetical protein YWIDRAFT_05201 [Streptomyces sp. SceaMP-e96]
MIMIQFREAHFVTALISRDSLHRMVLYTSTKLAH